MAPGDLEEVPDDAASAGVALEAEELLSVQPETPWTGEPETACAEGAEHLPENSDVTIELNLNECELSSQSAVPLVQAISGDAPPQHAEAQTRPLETPPPDSGHAVTRRMAPRGPDRADELLRAFVAAKEGETYLRAAAKNLRAFAGVDLTPSAAPMNAVSKRNEELSAPVPAGPSAEDLTPPGASKGTEDRRRPRSARLPSSKLARDLFAFGVGLLGATGLLYARPNLADDVISWVARTLPAHPPASPESVEETHSNAGAEPVSTAAEKAAP